MRPLLRLLPAVAALAPALFAPSGAGAQARPTVAVLYFDNGALVRPAEYAPLTKGMADMLITELSGNPALRVVERDRLQSIVDELKLAESDKVDRATAVRIGRLLNARHLLTGVFAVDPRERELRLDVRAIDVETSEIEFAETLSGEPGNVFGLINEISKRVSRRVAALPASGGGAPAAPSPGGAAPPAGTPATAPAAVTVATAPAALPKAGPDKFRAVMLLSRALMAQDKGQREQAIAYYKQAIELYPDYTRAKVLLAQLEARPARPGQ